VAKKKAITARERALNQSLAAKRIDHVDKEEKMIAKPV